jgi:hypothetical protein
MPSPRELVLLLLLICMEMTAGFALVVGSSLLDATSLHYGMFWLLLLSALVGLCAAVLVGRVGPGEPWNRISLIAGAFIGAVVPAVEASHNAVSFVVALFLLLIFLLAVAALQIFSFDVVGAVMNHTQGFWDALGATLYHGVTLVASPIQWFINLLRPNAHPHQVQPATVNPLGTAQQFGRKPKSPPKSNPAVVIVVLVIVGLILLALLYGVWRAIPRLRRREPDRGYIEERRSLSLAQMWAILFGWLRSVFSRGVVVAEEAVRAGRRRVLGDLPEDPVRRAYVRMLRRAAAAGLRREEGTTPGEFRARLVASWPAGSDDFSALTAAYMRRRYGEVASEEREIVRVGEQWKRLRILMRTPRFQPSPAAADAAASQSVAPEKTARRWRLPNLRSLIKLPGPSFGGETPKFSRSLAVAIFSFVAPLIIIIVLLAIFAILSNSAPKHHGLSHTAPAAYAAPMPAHLRDNVL